MPCDSKILKPTQNNKPTKDESPEPFVGIVACVGSIVFKIVFAYHVTLIIMQIYNNYLTSIFTKIEQVIRISKFLVKFKLSFQGNHLYIWKTFCNFTELKVY